MPLDAHSPPLPSTPSALSQGTVVKGRWRRLLDWFRRVRAEESVLPPEGEILHMDDWMLKDIGASAHVRDMAAQTRARHSRGPWDVHTW
ncbi:Uncharacterised protein [Bordetella ansorpii]|uniref:Uncharacterized protein n=1 Tax=Bordetella ansorpii TaxID=288768 RepID=A0A157SDJ9_9BORD|nr:hypothetical protein [Bordetella ansorpii]SAI67976.1 Uncharacterised protein [Bordetella ansorpii]